MPITADRPIADALIRYTLNLTDPTANLTHRVNNLPAVFRFAWVCNFSRILRSCREKIRHCKRRVRNYYWRAQHARQCYRCGLLLQTAWRGLCLPVCVLVKTTIAAKTVEPIEMQFGGGRIARARSCICWGPVSHFRGRVQSVRHPLDNGRVQSSRPPGRSQQRAAGASVRGDAVCRCRWQFRGNLFGPLLSWRA